jgi:CHASE3 domain sensor protein
MLTVEAETGVRGFIITGNDDFLVPYIKHQSK